MTDEEKLYTLVDWFKDNIQEYIDEVWDEQGYGEKNMPDAETFLGYDISDMTQEEIDMEVSEIQKEYYTCGECTNKELLVLFLEMIQ